MELDTSLSIAQINADPVQRQLALELIDRCNAHNRRPRSGPPTASLGNRSRRQPGESVLAPSTAKEQWESAVAKALVQCGGNRQRAASMVAKKRPELRARLVREANAANAPRAHRGQQPVARRQPGHRVAPRAMSKADFTQRVETLMQRDGMSKMEAARQLSREMGLSQQREEPGYFDQGRDRYR